jgi:hypothetical protein
MSIGIIISSNNYSGQTGDITFYPSTGGTINLGSQVIPYTYVSDYPYGVYDVYFPTYNNTCSISFPEPSPTPTNTPTSTPTPTITQTVTPSLTIGASPTPTPTITETPTNTPTVTQTVTPSLTIGVSPTPTPTITETPTPTPTETLTPTPTPVVEELINPVLVGNDEYITVGNDLYLMFVNPSPTPTPTPTSTPCVTGSTFLTITNTNWLYPPSDLETALSLTTIPYTGIGDSLYFSSITDMGNFYDEVFQQTAISQPVGNQGYSLGVGTELQNLVTPLFWKLLDTDEVIVMWILTQQLTEQSTLPSPGDSPNGTIGYLTRYENWPVNDRPQFYDPVLSEVGPIICVTPTPTPTETSLPITPTPSPTETSLPVTPTPTPTLTPQPVTGYGFNLVATPYNFPTSGNTIMNNIIPGSMTGSTNPNDLDTNGKGLYWNKIDSDGIDRTNYFSTFTGQSITITMSQNGSTAVYSGDINSFKYWDSGTDNGFVFGTGVGVPPTPSPSGNATLIQSAPTEWIIGDPVYISIVLN